MADDTRRISSIMAAEAKFNDNHTPERLDALYRNVFSFPKGNDYLKYFEGIPHPERYQEEEIGILESTPKPELNIPLLQRQMEFETVKDLIWYKLSDFEKRLFSLPDLIQRKLDRTSHASYRKTFAHLRDSCYAYLTTPADPNVQPDIQWIDYQFSTDYEPARKALRELSDNLFNIPAKRKLEEKLREAGAFGKEKKEFYFWNTDPVD